MIINKNTDKIRFSNLGETLEAPVIIQLLQRALENPSLISLAAGFTDNGKLPLAIVNEAVKELGATDALPTHLQYGSNQGRPGLRELTAEILGSYLNEKPEKFRAQDIIIGNGSQQILYLAMQVLCNQGDIVLVEGPSYFVFLEMLKGLGIKAVTMPMLENGCIDIKKLGLWLDERIADGTINQLKAIYLISYFANPSSHSVPLSDKEAIGKMIKDRDLNITIIEDGAYRDLYFNAPYPAPSILSTESMADLPCLYTGTYSKSLSSGLKIGFGCCNHPELLKKMLYVKGHHDFGSSNFTQAILERMILNGSYTKWVEGVHGHYGRKRACFEQVAKEENFAELGWTWSSPEGGLMLWVKGPEALDTSIGSEFNERCLQNGVFFVPGDLCFAEGEPKNCARLSIGGLELPALAEGLRRFIKTAREFHLK